MYVSFDVLDTKVCLLVIFSAESYTNCYRGRLGCGCYAKSEKVGTENFNAIELDESCSSGCCSYLRLTQFMPLAI